LYSNLSLELVFVFFCVGDSKKKSHKGQKKQQKAQERELFKTLRFSTYVFCTRERISVYLRVQNEQFYRKTPRSLFTSVCFSFVGVRRFIAKI